MGVFDTDSIRAELDEARRAHAAAKAQCAAYCRAAVTEFSEAAKACGTPLTTITTKSMVGQIVQGTAPWPVVNHPNQGPVRTYYTVLRNERFDLWAAGDAHGMTIGPDGALYSEGKGVSVDQAVEYLCARFQDDPDRAEEAFESAIRGGVTTFFL